MTGPIRLAALAALLLAACAGGRPGIAGAGAGPGRDAAAGLDELVRRSDPARAAERLAAALGRRPADPWARLGAALLARRALDAEGEALHLLALVEAAPGHPLALSALRRLAELADGSPELASVVEAGLAPLGGSGRLAGLAAFRARVARVVAAEALGDLDLLARLRAENGAVTAWTLAGPFGALPAMDLDPPIPPEQGTLPVEVPGPLLAPPRPSRPLVSPDGLVTLEGEPADADVHALASEVTLARGGRYLAVVGTSGSLRAWLDGAPLAERRGFDGHPPGQAVRPVELAPGRHVLLLKVTRAGGRAGVIVSLAREDGAPSDATSRPLPPGPLPPAAPGPFPPGAFTPAGLTEALAPGGAALARLVAARDAAVGDPEAAKALAEEGLAAAPGSALLRSARGALHAADATLDEQIARGRAEAALRAALEADPGEGEARIALAALLREADRAADADEVLAGLAEAQARRPAALAERARVADARGLSERAEALAAAARGAGGSCEALRLLSELAGRREAAAEKDELERALLGCRGGRERLSRHLQARGELAGALEALAPVLRARPLALGPALARAGLLSAGGDPAAAAASLAPLLEAWPRSAPLLLAAADHRELAGDAGGGRALRERALLVDGSDLSLRRALALEDGPEPLARDAVDAVEAVREYEASPRREEASSNFVLDAAAVELHPGGAHTERVHQVIRVNDQQGVDQFGEYAAPAGAQLLSLRTIKADGRVLEPEDGEGKGAASLSALEPGDYVDLEYLRSHHGGRGGMGVAVDAFYFATPGSAMFRSTWLVRAPRGLGLEVDAHGMAAPPVEADGPWEVARAERRLVPALPPEPGAPPGPEWIPFVQAGAGGGREAAQRLLAEGLADRLGPTLEIAALAREVRAAAPAGTGPEALARQAHERVRRLVAGHGGGLGDDAGAVLSRGRGSRVVLLAALLRSLGLEAHVAAVRPFGGDQVPYRFPAPQRWSSPVLRVRWPGGGAWLDPALRQQPFGALPERALGCEALVLPAPGEPLEVERTPEANAGPQGRELDLAVVLAEGGGAEVEGVDRYHGAAGAGAKAAFERLDEAARRQVVEQVLARGFRGLALAELSIEGEEEPGAPLTIRFRGTASALARDAGEALVVEAPLLAARLGARFLQLAARTTPLLVEAEERATLRLRVTPPPGLVARPAPPERLETPFGRYARAERVEGAVLLREDRLEVRRGRIPPADYPAFAAFAGGVDEAQLRPVAFGRR